MPTEQYPVSHGAPQSGAGWSNGTPPNGNWQGGGQA